MAAKDQYNIDRQIPEFNDVIVVGAGPVGLVASLLLSKYHVHHLLVEGVVYLGAVEHTNGDAVGVDLNPDSLVFFHSSGTL